MSTAFLFMANGAASTLRADHAVGDGTLKVQTGHGARFGTKWPGRAFAVTPSGAVVIYKLSGRTGDNLSIAGPIEGTSDIPLPSGSVVKMGWTEGAAEDIYAAINLLESGSGAGAAGEDGQVQVKLGTGFAAIAGTATGTNALALGPACVAVGNNSQAMGSGCGAYADGAIATGYLNKATGRYSHAEGLQTNAGYPLLSCTISGTTVTIHASAGDVTGDFACQDCSDSVTLSNLSGGTGPNVVKATIDGSSTGNGATFDGTNTILKLTAVVTSHTAGLVSNGEGGLGAHTEGEATRATADASHARGYAGLADVAGKSAQGGGWLNSVVGSCQKAEVVLGGISTSATPVILEFSGSTASPKRPIIRAGHTYSFVAQITARKTDGSAHASFLRRGLVHNEAGATALVGAVATIGTDINTPGWTVTITADDAGDAIQVSVVGETTVHWSCCLECVEVG